MKHGFIKVAAATPRVTVADCKANGEEILKAIHEMEKETCQADGISGILYHRIYLSRSFSPEMSSGQCVG